MNVLFLTAHDYRTARRTSIHFIAEQLAKRGTTRFFSLRYSALSRFKNDPRQVLDASANRPANHRGVDCYLWKVLIHPFRLRGGWSKPIENRLFKWYADHPPEILIRWIKEADTIVFESGTSVVFFELAERINPGAKKIYRASDDLATINVADFVARTFEKIAARMSAICMLSPQLAIAMPRTTNQYFVGQGVDPSIMERAGPSPYTAPLNAVSVGSMLFDPGFFRIAAAAFPEVVFHVIGSGQPDDIDYPANVKVYGEMAHDDTLAYIKHAQIGIAPYRGDNVPTYLADSSLKLVMYELFGVPAVCPATVTGGRRSRFGYLANSPDSIVEAVRAALAAGRFDPPRLLTWSDIADRLIDPARYPDTHLAPH